MKTCPKCNRTFPDEGQKFCTFDGGLLIAPQTFDPNATIRATSIDLNAPAERPTSRDLPDPNATMIESYPATVALPRNTGPTNAPTTTGAPNTSDFSRPAEPAPPPPPPPAAAPPAQPPVSRTTAEPLVPPAPAPPVIAPPPPTAPSPPPTMAQQPAPSAPLPPPVAKKKSKAPWIIAGVLLFLLLGGAAIAGAFFFVIKPRLDRMAAVNKNVNENRSVETTTNVPTPVPTIAQPSPASTPADTYVPPSDATLFASSKEGLEGPLAEHYFDFYFYYPKSWQRIQTTGAQNFVKVERRLPPDFTQENFVVRWYPSTGTFVGDLPKYPQQVEEFSASLAKAFPNYRKVSEQPTKVNSMQGYEFRWEGLSKGTEKGDLHLWGRVIFLPTGHEGDTNGAILSIFTTSLTPDLSSVEDVGVRGEAPVILDSFRFGRK